MAESDILGEDRIQDYIDDRLNERDRANVAAYLLANPEIGAEVEKLRRQNEALKSVGQEILEEPVPDRLRSVLHQQARIEDAAPASFVRIAPRSYFLEAAAALLLFIVGGGAGWLLHGQLNPSPSDDDLLTAQMAYAYGFYDAERDYPIDFSAERLQDFEAWITRSFERPVPPPDLGGFNYRFAGGRRLPTASAPVGLFQFENDEQKNVSIFFWRKNARSRGLPNWSDDDRNLVKIWVEGDINLAVISDKETPDFDNISDSVNQFYRQALAIK